jgi:FG-GAP repeat
MSAVFTYGPAASIRIVTPEVGRSVSRLAGVLALGVALASPAQAQFGDLSPEAGDAFGYAFARGDFNGDGFQDLAIGAPYESIRMGFPSRSLQIEAAGAVEVIYGSATGLQSSGRQFWRQGSDSVGDAAEANDEFGWSLTAGDFNGDNFTDLAIGVPREDIAGITNAGAVHVLYGSPQGLSTSAVAPQFWHQDSPGVKEWAEPNDFFGWALAAGDFNDDGYADLAIGVPIETVGTASEAGAVHILFGSPSGLTVAVPDDQLWTQDSPDVEGVIQAGNRFGYSLTAGDFNCDGFDDLAIGVPRGDFLSDNDFGVVNVIYGSKLGLSANFVPDELLRQAPELSNDGAVSLDFGFSLAVGDFNGDGFDDLAVGVPHESLGPLPGVGAVNAFYGSPYGLESERKPQFWHQNRPGVEDVAEPFEDFGWKVTAGDFNNDGCDDLAIDVPFEFIDGVRVGVVNVIYGSHGSGLSLTVVPDQLWYQGSPGMPTVPAADEGFGWALLAGDFNGDGYAELAVGVPFEDVNGAPGAGSVNVIHGAPGGLNATYIPVQVWTQQFVLAPRP